jgi:hypothetical protein
MPDSGRAGSNPEVIMAKASGEQNQTRIPISQHKAYSHVVFLINGRVKYRAKTKSNTFLIAPVESSGPNKSDAATHAYWQEDKSVIFLDLRPPLLSADELKDYVVDEIYEKYRRDLRADVVPTEAEVVSRYFISKAEANLIVTDCLKHGEKVLINKVRK